MSYSSHADVFYGVLLPEHLNFTIEDEEVSNIGLILVYMGNFVCGPVQLGLAIKSFRIEESEVLELGSDFTPEENEKLELLKLFLKEHNILDYKISWYCGASYG